MKLLDRLKQQYEEVLTKKNGGFYLEGFSKLFNDYKAMRLFCLDCELLSFNDIEAMEYEVNYPSS